MIKTSPVEIRKLTKSDTLNFTDLIQIFGDVFEMENLLLPDEEYLQKQLTKDDFLVFVAMSNNKVIGGLTLYILRQYYSKSPLVYIYDLAIKTEFQRQGIGKLLIARVITYCKEIMAEEIFVQADLEDDYAIDFYRSTGATAKHVAHFSYVLSPKGTYT